jgi:lipoprotein-anchoring transpeptidase ErfK/SrfK
VKHPARTISSFPKILFLLAGVAVAFSAGVFWKSLPQFACGGNPEVSDGRFAANEILAWFNGERVSPMAEPLAMVREEGKGKKEEGVVLGETSGEKWIDVDLSTQTVRAMEGDNEVLRMLASTGKWAPTPTGEYRIWIKLRYTKMSGGKKENNTYYYLPNVPYVMYFYQGYGLHGAYWHNNFGQPMSHGCVNLSIADAEKLFYWADPQMNGDQWTVKATADNPGTRVVVHGTAPRT